MKVLFVTRYTLHSIPGGDTIQMEFTAKHLARYGVEVDFLSQQTTLDYGKYDLIHFFNLTRPAPILARLKETNKPYIISTIYSDYSFYKQLPENRLMWALTNVFGIDGIEYLKAVVKHFLKQDPIKYPPYFWLGQRRSIQKILKNASGLLPNSTSEYNRLIGRFKVTAPYYVVPNGVDFDKFKVLEGVKRKKNQLICVALIEPRKNQLNLIKAISGTAYTLKIIGDPAPNHIKYLEKCKKIAGDNVEFIPRIPQDELVQHYLESEIHVMPSWFETTGLSSLEAAYLGCKIIVAPKGDTRDYFKDYVEYCEPGSVESIKQALDKVSKASYDTTFKEVVEKEYTWSAAAKCTYEAYLSTLKHLK